MSNDKKPSRPTFAAVHKPATYKSPEEVFGKLPGRADTHAYLRGPQQDVLREYAEKHTAAANVAAELPTGTGKTAVGLLIAESHRQAARRVAFLALTNQLAGQVIDEAKRLGVPCADLRGRKEDRNAAEEGRFMARGAVGISTYSNLFNINPVIKECDILVLDDAHGAEQHVTEMWTVTARKSEDATLFKSLLTDLRPGMSESLVSAILNPSGFRSVEMVDVLGHPESLAAVTATLDKVTTPSIRFSWGQIRNRLPVCLFLVSSYEITIRPLIPPTHKHAPFAGAIQRIYMSATLGGDSDLRRAYGIDKVDVVRAKSQQWGRRYVFVPGVYANASDADTLVASVWDDMSPRRAVLLAPSDKTLTQAYNAVTKPMKNGPTRFMATDIQDSVDGFVKHNAAILTLAARYDGLDLPGDQCRLLVMAESPAATNALERQLSERWKLGPVLRRRERTRLIQGMGRCTRNATDFAVIIWLGQSLVNAATSQALLAGMPAELAAEISWGLKQTEAVESLDEITSMIDGLLTDQDYRKAADASIAAAVGTGAAETPPKEYDQVGVDEVRYARAMWDEDYGHAYGIARSIADRLNAADLSGYRAWWWYLASMAASLAKDNDGQKDTLTRGSACGVNSGWLRRVMIHRAAGAAADVAAEFEPNAEAVWDLLEDWGWAGPEFAENLKRMIGRLESQYHTEYHEGLEVLGKCLGATTLRITEPGAPDVVWSFHRDEHFVFEAKTEKKGGGKLSKSDLLEAKGHIDWVKARVAEDKKTSVVVPIVVSPESTVHEVGEPFKGGLHHLSPDQILAFAKHVADEFWKLRIKYAGKDYPSAQSELCADLRAMKLDFRNIDAFLKQKTLSK